MACARLLRGVGRRIDPLARCIAEPIGSLQVASVIEQAVKMYNERGRRVCVATVSKASETWPAQSSLSYGACSVLWVSVYLAGQRDCPRFLRDRDPCMNRHEGAGALECLANARSIWMVRQ